MVKNKTQKRKEEYNKISKPNLLLKPQIFYVVVDFIFIHREIRMILPQHRSTIIDTSKRKARAKM